MLLHSVPSHCCFSTLMSNVLFRDQSHCERCMNVLSRSSRTVLSFITFGHVERAFRTCFCTGLVVILYLFHFSHITTHLNGDWCYCLWYAVVRHSISYNILINGCSTLQHLDCSELTDSWRHQLDVRIWLQFIWSRDAYWWVINFHEPPGV